MHEHSPVCDLMAARGFSSAAVILFILVAILQRLNETRKENIKTTADISFQSPEKTSALGVFVDKNSSMGESSQLSGSH